MPDRSSLRLTLLCGLLPLALTAPSAAKPRAEVGRISGSVEISSALAARRPRFRIYSEAGPGGVPPTSQRADAATELRNVVVYLESDPAKVLASASTDGGDSLRRGSMAQANERFEPHVLAVLQGARVEFPNHDDVYHNVFSLSSVRSFDLGRYPKGRSKSVAFPKTGIAQVFCHIHSDMSAIVLVLGNVFFTAPESTGRYTIGNVPPGEYTIVGWHERTKPVSRRVRVVAGETATVNFSLPLEPRSQQ
jgi:plastocyanin